MSENLTCRHCGEPIQEGEAFVNWPWIHASGFYRCIPWDSGTKAEPAANPTPNGDPA